MTARVRSARRVSGPVLAEGERPEEPPRRARAPRRG